MTGLANSGFETAGLNPGEADSWTHTTVATAFEVAGPPAVETFEDWTAGYLLGFAPGDIEVALYDSTTVFALAVDGFEVLWDGNESYLFSLGAVASAAYDAGAGPGTANVEHFEQAWSSNESYLFAFAPGDIAALGIGTEDFEGWVAGYKTAFAPGDLSAASYDVAPQAVEDFENEWTLVMTTM